MNKLKVLKASKEPLIELDIDAVVAMSFEDICGTRLFPSNLKLFSVLVFEAEDDPSNKTTAVVNSIYYSDDEVIVDIDYVDSQARGPLYTFRMCNYNGEFYLEVPDSECSNDYHNMELLAGYPPLLRS